MKFIQHNRGSRLGPTSHRWVGAAIRLELLGSLRNAYQNLTSTDHCDHYLSSSANRTSQPQNSDLLGGDGELDPPPKYSELEISQDGLDTKARVTGSLPDLHTEVMMSRGACTNMSTRR